MTMFAEAVWPSDLHAHFLYSSSLPPVIPYKVTNGIREKGPFEVPIWHLKHLLLKTPCNFHSQGLKIPKSFPFYLRDIFFPDYNLFKIHYFGRGSMKGLEKIQIDNTLHLQQDSLLK